MDPGPLAARIARLEDEASRRQVLHQQLVVAKGQIDLELQRFQAIQRYVQQAVLVESLPVLHTLTLEAVVEAFQFEVALFLDWRDQLFVSEAFGFDQTPPRTLAFEPEWLEGRTSRLLNVGDAILDHWSVLGLRDAIIAPLLDKTGAICSVLLGGRTIARGEFFQPVTTAQNSSFEVLASQAEALFRNFAMAAEIREHNQRLKALTRSYSRFVPFAFLELLGRSSIEAVLPADHMRLDMTVLFTDLRDFTATSESLGPEKAFGLLNEYLRAMEPEISGCHGFINQYLGDGFVALFHEGADNGMAAAVGMTRALADLNAHRTKRDEPSLRIGIGINSGELMLGATGSEQRLDGNVVGDAVNLASRVEALTKQYGATCLVTDGTVARITDTTRHELRELDRVLVVGRTAPVVIHEVLDVDPPSTRSAKLATHADFRAGLWAYRQGRFGEASAYFARCLEEFPDDHAAALYVRRCAELARNPPPDRWQGVTVLDRK